MPETPSYRSTSRFVAESVEGLMLMPLVTIAWPFARRILENWGSLPAERDRKWPGDSLTNNPDVVFTRAVSVNADSETVWPWLVQFGLGRAGFYSYELLERLAGIPVRNVESIVVEHQELSPGDGIRLHPTAPAIPVGVVEPGRALCFGGDLDGDSERPDPPRSWSMYLEPAGEATCRLILRTCIEAPQQPTVGKRVALAVEEPIDFVMEQRMLRSIKRLAENAAARAS